MSAKVLFTLPNLITGVRLVLAPVIAFQILSHQFQSAFVLLFIAGTTDWFDGFFARRYNSASDLGRLFDPLADKVLLTSVFVALFLVGFLPWWLALAMIGRDVLILGGAFLVWFYKLPLCLEPLWVSKINTFFQIFLSLGLLIHPCIILPFAEGFLVILIYGTLTTTLLSGFAYAKLFFSVSQK